MDETSPPQGDTTAFAPSKRLSPAAARRQRDAFLAVQGRELVDSLPLLVLVLNACRQMIFANRAGLDFLGAQKLDDILGLRPGEALGCVNAASGPGGCGTSAHCRACEAIAPILRALEGAESRGMCTMLRRGDNMLESLEFSVTATPLSVDGQACVVYTATDVSHLVRRRSMERIFFHDVLNLAGGIDGLVGLLQLTMPEQAGPELKVLHDATASLVDEIVAQRELQAAETNDLRPIYGPVNTLGLLSLLAGLHGSSSSGQGQAVLVEADCAELLIETDARLVRRVLGNMVKNALEAGRPGDRVRLNCLDEGERVRFVVLNDAVMPEAVRESVFRRRVSTKGEGRGLGTYSMLLLAERYLGGEVGFFSREGEGTRFHLLLPKRVERA